MYWIILYVFASIVIAVTAAIYAGWVAGLSAIGASLIALFASTSLRTEISTTPKSGAAHDLRWAGIISTIIALAFAWWLSRYFGVQLFGYFISGTIWAAAGAVIGFATARRTI
jgi:hypothetical protein